MSDDAMWRDWREHYRRSGMDPDDIARDGIVDLDAWANAPSKVLFVLKEVNDHRGQDLREFLREGPKYQMWHTVARWASGLLGGFPPFQQVDSWDAMHESLQRIACINLKKADGGSSAHMPTVNAFALHDRHFLRRQIESIRPDILVACGTWDSVGWILDLALRPDREEVHPLWDEKRRLWALPWMHPGRKDNVETYNSLRELVAQIPSDREQQ